ncbi:MAG: hypothetical protein KBG15_16030 [Kofleriaceae bacterium]|nr:hypothetical protein [Kofleriaceae bacterium]
MKRGAAAKVAIVWAARNAAMDTLSAAPIGAAPTPAAAAPAEHLPDKLPTAIKRALLLRDRTCRFPGCTRSRYVAGYHMVELFSITAAGVLTHIQPAQIQATLASDDAHPNLAMDWRTDRQFGVMHGNRACGQAQGFRRW